MVVPSAGWFRDFQLHVLSGSSWAILVDFGSVNCAKCLINTMLTHFIPLSLSVPNKALPGLLTSSNE